MPDPAWAWFEDGQEKRRGNLRKYAGVEAPYAGTKACDTLAGLRSCGQEGLRS